MSKHLSEKMSAKKLLKSLCFLVPSAVLLYALIWWFLAIYLVQIQDDWIAEWKNDGNELSFEDRSRSGFPFTWSLDYKNFLISKNAGSGNKIDITGPLISLHWSPLEPKAFSLSGSDIRLEGTNGSQADKLINVMTTHFSGKIGPRRQTWRRYSVRARNVSLLTHQTYKFFVSEIGSKILIQKPVRTEVTVPEIAKITAEMVGITFPKEIKISPPPVIKELLLKATLSGEVRDSGSIKSKLSHWRDTGGVIDLNRLFGRSETADIDLNGTLTLDRALRPLVSISMKLSGLKNTLNKVARAGFIKPSDLLILRILLASLSEPTKDGKERITLSLSVQDGWLYIGPLKVFRLEPVLD